MINYCSGCIYFACCGGRRRRKKLLEEKGYSIDESVDCFIPEADLRQLQKEIIAREEFVVEDYACLTDAYVEAYKAKSSYWLKEKKRYSSTENSK